MNHENLNIDLFCYRENVYVTSISSRKWPTETHLVCNFKTEIHYCACTYANFNSKIGIFTNRTSKNVSFHIEFSFRVFFVSYKFQNTKIYHT